MQLGGELLTISTIASGGYKDGEDYEDICHYVQHGGNDYKGKMRLVEYQKIKVGKEALMNNYKLLFKVASCTSTNLSLMIAIIPPLPPNSSGNLHSQGV
jgi:hypothetical protein